MSTVGTIGPDAGGGRASALYKLLRYGAVFLLFAVCVELMRRAFAPLSQDQFSFGDLFISRLLLAAAPLPIIIAVLTVAGTSRLSGRLHQTNFPLANAFLSRLITFLVFGGAAFIALFFFDPIGIYASAHSKAVIPFFYVTDRKTAPGPTPGLVIFTDDPSIQGNVSYGMGMAPIRWSRSDVFQNLHSKVSLSWNKHSDALQGISSDEFYSRVALVAGAAEHRDTILFVHGFHNQFGQAINTTARLAYDLKFTGPIILYSWPSGSAVSSYDRDYENADWSVKHLQEVLLKLSVTIGAQNLNLIAHSMGARVLVNAIDSLPQSDVRGQLFNNIVLAAADINEAQFSQASDALRSSSRRITLYVSTWDAALLASYGLHKMDRIGMQPVQRQGMDVINTEGRDTSLRGFNHGYLFDSQPVLFDLSQLLHDNLGPESRRGIRKADHQGCWTFKHR